MFVGFLGYLFFAHLIIESDAIVNIENKYVSNLLFEYKGWYFYSSLFYLLKSESFIFLSGLGGSFEELKNFLGGYEPHTMLISILATSGPIICCLVLILIFNYIKTVFNFDDERRLSLTILCVLFLCESFLWDSQDSVIFWLGLMLPQLIIKNIIHASSHKIYLTSVKQRL